MLQGERVVLRPIEREDLPRLRDLVETVEVLALASSWHPIPPSLEHFESRSQAPQAGAAPESVWFALEVRGDVGGEDGGEVVGECGLHRIDHLGRACELGIRIGAPYWGRGYGQDAVRTIVDYAFRMLNMRKVSLEVFANDARALGAYRAAGFTEEGRRRAHAWYDGAYRDTLIMAIFREEPPPDTASI
jgi:RimJ/RimL family protein N-acetyltransferase